MTGPAEGTGPAGAGPAAGTAAPESVREADEPLLHMPHVTMRAWRRVVLGAAVLFTVLGIVLLLACWRADRAIESHKGVASAQVLSAGHIRSSITFTTPDGTTWNPPAGVLYPTGLAPGEFIQVEYDKRDPDLVRPEGRNASVAVVPVGSVLLGIWAVAAGVLFWMRVHRRRAERGHTGRDSGGQAGGHGVPAPGTG